MRLYFVLFLTVYWLFLILAPLNAFAEDNIYTCKPVIAGYPQKDGKFYMEVEDQDSSPLLDTLSVSQFLIRGENFYYKNNQNREFEILTPYEKIADSKEIQDIEKGLGSWDEMLSFDKFRTFYFKYKNNGYESLKRISINKKKTRTSEITMSFHDDFPAYFFLRKCVRAYKKKPIEVDFQESFNKKLS